MVYRSASTECSRRTWSAHTCHKSNVQAHCDHAKQNMLTACRHSCNQLTRIFAKSSLLATMLLFVYVYRSCLQSIKESCSMQESLYKAATAVADCLQADPCLKTLYLTSSGQPEHHTLRHSWPISQNTSPECLHAQLNSRAGPVSPDENTNIV